MNDLRRKGFLIMTFVTLCYLFATKQQESKTLTSKAKSTTTYQQYYRESTELQKCDNFTVDDKILNELCYIDLNIKKWAPGKQIKFCNPPGAEGMLSNRNWEANFQEILFNTLFKLVPDAAFIDIGGLLGVYTLSAATLGRQVFTFEPFWTFDYIKTSVVKNKLTDRVSLYKMALLDEVRCAILTTPDEPPNFGRMLIKDSIFYCDKSPQRVQVATLDQLLPTFRRLGIKKAIIKIDIEGSEPKAMLGGSKLLEEIDIPFVQMEFDKVKDQLLGRPGEDKNSADKFIEMMKKLQYVAGPMSSSWNVTTLDPDKVLIWPNDVLWYKKQR